MGEESLLYQMIARMSMLVEQSQTAENIFGRLNASCRALHNRMPFTF